jgi:hypothetical protein
MTSLSAMIGSLCSPLGPHLERNITIALYFSSTLIAIIGESDRRISFNSLKKFVTSLSAVIEALRSPLELHPERDLVTDLYSGSNSIAIKVSPITRLVSDDFKKL